jgi:hypothetical protein
MLWHKDTDPDPDFQSNADPDLDWLKNDADLNADPFPCFTHDRKSVVFKTFVHSNTRLQCLKFLYHQWHGCHNFKYFGQRIEIF